MSLVPQNYWDHNYEECLLEIAPHEDPLREWLERYVERGNGTCLEIGCFPGRYLAVFGELGFQLHGLDMTPRVVSDLPNWLRARNYNVGSFEKVDFRNYVTGQEFDIVASFGFIEHFKEWRELLIKQASLVRKGGYIVVSTPNFTGWTQRLLHRALDRENYLRHFTPSMYPLVWETVVAERGFETVYCGTFGKFEFWVEAESRNIFQIFCLSALKYMTPLFKRFPKDKKAYSPYSGLIARKL